MPTLRLLDDDGGLRALAPLGVYAVMAYPQDAAKREEFLASITIGALAEASATDIPAPVEVPMSLIRALWRAPAPDAALAGAVAPADFAGIVAGDLLLHVLTLALHTPRLASLNKASAVVERLYLRAKRPASRASIMSAWSQYKPVAHLWGAWRLYVSDFERPEALNWATPEGLPGFLAVGEALREQGERHFAPGQSRRGKPLLDPETTWRVPGGVELPTIQIQLPPPTAEALSIIHGAT